MWVLFHAQSQISCAFLLQYYSQMFMLKDSYKSFSCLFFSEWRFLLTLMCLEQAVFTALSIWKCGGLSSLDHEWSCEGNIKYWVLLIHNNDQMFFLHLQITCMMSLCEKIEIRRMLLWFLGMVSAGRTKQCCFFSCCHLTHIIRATKIFHKFDNSVYRNRLGSRASITSELFLAGAKGWSVKVLRLYLL